jgi:protein-S-isoprenylcysteine O-methyltransferase Ste14
LGIQPGHHLVTNGPYRLVRHPGYLSTLLAFLGMSLAMSSVAALVLTALAVPLMIMRISGEEKMLVGAWYRLSTD